MKYREGQTEAGGALYHRLPETPQTNFSKQMSELQSQVLPPPSPSVLSSDGFCPR